jgi:hypothetical protein
MSPASRLKRALVIVIKQLLKLRKQTICTSNLLARVVAKEMDVVLEASTIRKILKRHGYRWRRRSQKPIFTKRVMKLRRAFAWYVKKMPAKKLREKLALAIDGVVIIKPPSEEVARENYCRHGETHMYRLASESVSAELAGADLYAKQAPLCRCIPMWGGISEGGYAEVLYHKYRKVDESEWSTAVENGKLLDAIKKLKPISRTGPWTVLTDGESFLRTKESNKAYRKCKVRLWQIPPRSPDLNPIEKFWSWLRRRLRALDFADLRAKRPVPGKIAYRQRVRNVCRSKKAQRVAAACAKGLRKVCQEVLRKKGAASRA